MPGGLGEVDMSETVMEAVGDCELPVKTLVRVLPDVSTQMTRKVAQRRLEEHRIVREAEKVQVLKKSIDIG